MFACIQSRRVSERAIDRKVGGIHSVSIIDLWQDGDRHEHDVGGIGWSRFCIRAFAIVERRQLQHRRNRRRREWSSESEGWRGDEEEEKGMIRV